MLMMNILTLCSAVRFLLSALMDGVVCLRYEPVLFVLEKQPSAQTLREYFSKDVNGRLLL